jgi:acyl dehydratase
MGIAARAILTAYCNDRPERIRSFSVRFTKPVFPGETLKFEFSRERDSIRFRARVVERDTIVLDRCTATVA